MKKLLSLTLAVVLLCCFAAFAAADSDNVTITPTILSQMDLTVDKCIASSDSRALYTLLAVAEVCLDKGITSDESIAFLTGTSYVGKSDNGNFVITILLDSTGNYLLLTYDPVNNNLLYNVTKGHFSASVIENVLKENCLSYHENSLTALNNMAQKLSDIINN